MPRKILGSLFKHPASSLRYIGIVAAETDEHLPQDMRTWQAYIGICSSEIKSIDENSVITVGAKLSAVEAAGLFPGLDITKYKK